MVVRAKCDDQSFVVLALVVVPVRDLASVQGQSSNPNTAHTVASFSCTVL